MLMTVADQITVEYKSGVVTFHYFCEILQMLFCIDTVSRLRSAYASLYPLNEMSWK